jgi:hypothetical protein
MNIEASLPDKHSLQQYVVECIVKSSTLYRGVRGREIMKLARSLSAHVTSTIFPAIGVVAFLAVLHRSAIPP